jgi:arsenate reductase
MYFLSCLFSCLRYAGTTFEKVNYKKEPFTEKLLKEIIEKLKIDPIELVEKNHPEWKYMYSKLHLTNEEIIQVLIENHNLIVRPIVVSGNKAIIGRPPKNLVNFIKEQKYNHITNLY